MVIRAKRLAVFVDGDFWHGNAWRLRGLPSIEAQFPTNTEWWTAKIRRNVERDREVTEQLEASGWRVVRVWESDVLRDPGSAAEQVLDKLRLAAGKATRGGYGEKQADGQQNAY